jgi:hypothetical protein
MREVSIRDLPVQPEGEKLAGPSALAAPARQTDGIRLAVAAE